MKRIILINLSLIILFTIFSELFIGFFKLSEIMGIDSNLFIEGDNTYSFKKNGEGKVYGKLIYTDNDGFRMPSKEFNCLKNKPSIFVRDDLIHHNHFELDPCNLKPSQEVLVIKYIDKIIRLLKSKKIKNNISLKEYKKLSMQSWLLWPDNISRN